MAITVDSTEWRKQDWRELCSTLGARINEKRLQALEATARRSFTEPPPEGFGACMYISYTIEPDGRIKQQTHRVATEAEQDENFAHAASDNN